MIAAAYLVCLLAAVVVLAVALRRPAPGPSTPSPAPVAAAIETADPDAVEAILTAALAAVRTLPRAA
ncbi:hypothetical protein AB0G74_33885 [Streptomyces sp. NPDC020875]|uniref:hypothetical protein n=1 Tax=Streptomyces sp. NPDC020875 TaxID=3154898 RepID=UPI0033E77460